MFQIPKSLIFFQMGLSVNKIQIREELIELFVKNVMPKPQRDIFKKNVQKLRKISENNEIIEHKTELKRKIETVSDSNNESDSNWSTKKKFKPQNRISFP